MTTLLPSFFIVDLGRMDDLRDEELPENGCIVFSLTTGNLPFIDSFYPKIMSAERKYPFCLLIDVDDGILADEASIKKIIDFVLLASFHYQYTRSDLGDPFLLFGDGMAHPGKMISPIRGALLGQGYNDIEPLVLDGLHVFSWPENNKKGIRCASQNSSEELMESWLGSMGAMDLPEFYFFFDVDVPLGFPALLETLNTTEEMLRRQHPQLHHVLLAAWRLKKEQRRLRSELGLLQERLDSRESYNSFYNPAAAHMRKQITEISEFYKYEYDILPLWYKRLGHIIKVLMGKRTFRSLFDDKVKKYKA